jgi:uncharacterized protein (TIGR02452 family)
MFSANFQQNKETQKRSAEAKEYRKQVWQDTYNYIQQTNSFPIPTAIITKHLPMPLNHTKHFVTEIYVIREDCLYVAKEILDVYPEAKDKIAVLNMSDISKMGGGYEKGDGAQEEELMRRTTLYFCLSQLKEAGVYIKDSESCLTAFDTIYSANVTVIKTGRDLYNHQAGYELLIQPFQVNIVSSAAYNLEKSEFATFLKSTGESDSQGYPIFARKSYEEFSANEKELFEKYKENTQLKIRQQLRTAIINGNEYFVLSAFGCGAFYNDPKIISQLYKQVLNEDEFNGAFKVITFAIFPNPGQNNKNAEVFENTFKQLTCTSLSFLKKSSGQEQDDNADLSSFNSKFTKNL